MRLLLCTVLLGFGLSHVFAQQSGAPSSAYKIEVELRDFLGDTIYLANYLMDKQYLADTAIVKAGKAVFTGEEKLPEGTYLVVLPPENRFAQVLIDADQHFTLKTSALALSEEMEIEGSSDNTLFYGYLNFLAEMRPVADSIRNLLQDSTLTAQQEEALKGESSKVDEQVAAYQAKLLEEHPESITATLIKALREPEIPEFTGTPEEVQEQSYRWYKSHYFDNIDLGDPRGLRSSYMDQRVMYYLEKLTVPVPDSISLEIDYLLSQMRPAEETFQRYTSKFLNKYASSKIVGQDAIYVHIAEKYYMSGTADWVDSLTLDKITENVERVKPLLIGKPAPQMKTQTRDKQVFDLYADKSPWTVLFFYSPDCNYCKKQTPAMVQFAKDFKDKGVKVVSICSKFAPDHEDCWKYVDEKEGMPENLINTIDPFHRSKFKILYDVRSTPQVYVLDADKTIVSKRIAAEQLPEVVSRLIEIRENEEIEKQLNK